ncbi:hypothetical protein [Marinimicrobium agarilyticum]|uniref:hypothetical protein n=1 Tax=Marinimicrobium agarilyticum TaxID=306546 RepID=UPI0003FB2766|nr:hypothetical protein [Marinimicrobium agarilyticum]
MTTFELSHFDDFLAIASQQSEPQKLLLVLAKRELPHGHTEEQARAFAEGHGGHLAPLAGIDKQPSELEGFTAFVEEAKQVGSEWDAVFVAALPGTGDRLPSTKEIDDAIEKVIHAIRNGMINNLLVFDRSGTPLQINHG